MKAVIFWIIERMRTVILWVYAGILTCCLIFLLILVTNKTELAKFQNGVSTFMQDKHTTQVEQTNDTTTTYRAVANGQADTENATNSGKEKAQKEANRTFVISLTSVSNELSSQWKHYFTSQGSIDNER